jgi:hypothetical protein
MSNVRGTPVPKWLLYVGGLFAGVGVLFCLLLVSGYVSRATASCAGYPVMSVDSAAGTYRAKVENNTCDPDGALETVVMLSKIGPRSSDVPLGWSAFIASSTVVAGPGVYAPLQLNLHWLSDSEIEIAYPAGTNLRSRAETAHGVSVSYVERRVP